VATIVHGDDGDQECDFVDNAISWVMTMMIKENTEMKATTAKKAMRMMRTTRMAMAAMTPPTM
jgi:hypothetical protein